LLLNRRKITPTIRNKFEENSIEKTQGITMTTILLISLLLYNVIIIIVHLLFFLIIIVIIIIISIINIYYYDGSVGNSWYLPKTALIKIDVVYWLCAVD